VRRRSTAAETLLCTAPHCVATPVYEVFPVIDPGGETVLATARFRALAVVGALESVPSSNYKFVARVLWPRIDASALLKCPEAVAQSLQ
jgi:hypothetical protein